MYATEKLNLNKLFCISIEIKSACPGLSMIKMRIFVIESRYEILLKINIMEVDA